MQKIENSLHITPSSPNPSYGSKPFIPFMLSDGSSSDSSSRSASSLTELSTTHPQEENAFIPFTLSDCSSSDSSSSSASSITELSTIYSIECPIENPSLFDRLRTPSGKLSQSVVSTSTRVTRSASRMKSPKEFTLKPLSEVKSSISSSSLNYYKNLSNLKL